MKVEQLGPYKIHDPIGRGGMGTVYRAEDCETGRNAAVKVLSPVVSQDAGFRERFEAEVQSLKQLKHPNIVQLFGYGEQDGQLFYAMELVEGPSLQEEISDGHRFSWREAVQVIIDICGALKHAHDHGIIHRDIKPANLLIVGKHSPELNGADANGALGDDEEKITVKLADFGIAKLFGSSSMTVDGGVLGTADYMSPEQAEGEPVTPRSDLYSLGSVFYAMLSGQPPFRGKSMPDVLHKVRFEPHKPIGRLVDDVPKELEHIINQLLAKSPADRVPTALALSNRLQSLQHGMTMKIDRALQRDAEFDTTPEPEPSLFAQDTMAAPVDVHQQSTEPLEHSGQDHFVAVDAERERATKQDQGESLVWRAITILALLVPLLLMIWGGYQIVAPPSADELYNKVSSTAKRVEEYYNTPFTAKAPMPSLEAHRDEVNSFLNRFPDDPRVEEMKTWNRMILASQLESRLERKTKLGWESSEVSPIEDLVLSAMKHEENQPSKALEQYHSLLKMFPSDPDRASEIDVLIRSVEGRIAKLKLEMRRRSDRHVALIQNRLEKALAISRKSPEEAREIITAVIRLYSDSELAQDELLLARRMLAAIDTTNANDLTEDE